jgi:alpha-tubulin suppressor-like RCC1 family protein
LVTGTTASVTGLTNGTPYTFTVAATNGAGTGPASVAFGPFTPFPPPVVTISVSPANVPLFVGQQQAFAATVSPANTAVTWSVTPVPGATIHPTTGVFSSTVAGNYTVRATTVTSPPVSATATATVGPVRVPVAQPIDGTSGSRFVVGGAYDPLAGQFVAQVVAGYPGNIVGVKVPVDCMVGAQLVIQIQGVTAGVPNGVVRAQKVVPNADQLLPSTYMQLDQFNPIYFDAPVSAANDFAVVLSSGYPDCSILQGPSGDPYPGGDAYFFNGNTAGAWRSYGVLGTNDFAFRILSTSPVVGVSPGSVALLTGDQQTFNAAIDGTPSTAVTWSVTPTSGATIGSTSGVFSATVAGSYTVKATSTVDPMAFNSAVATVTAPVPVTSVAVAPLDPAATVDTPLVFTATINGSPSTAVTWSVSPTGATISQDGSFLAIVRGDYTVTATSQADPTKSASTVVTAWGPFFTTFTLAITPSPSGFADPVSMTAAFTAPYDWPQPTGTVTFSDNLAWGFEFTPVTLPFTCTRSPATLTSPWECSVTISPAPAWVRAGSHRVYADYNGDAFYDTDWAQFDTEVLNPVPVLAYLGSVSRYRGGTDHHLKVTNWGQYDSYSFYSDYGAPCAPYSWSAHTQVDVLDGATGALLQGYCSMVKPTDLQDFTFFVDDLVAPPTSVKVKMTDRWWNTVTESNVVAVPPPFVAPPEQAASTVAAGGNSTFFLAPGGTAMALGQNLGGQLGTGSVTDVVLPNPTPVAMPGGVAVRSIDAASWHGMAIDVTGSLWAWGWGPAISEPATRNLAPVFVGLGDYGASVTTSAISAGYGHGLVLMSNGDVWGIGDDQWGQFSGTSYGAIRSVNHPLGVVAVAAGEHHSMLLASDGTVWTLGRNEYGQLGDGTSSGVGSTFTRTTPLPVVGLYQVVAIAAGSFHSVALRADGTVWTWGHGTQGQLGNGGSADVGSPVQVLGVGGTGFLTNVQKIATGNNHTLALLGDGTLCAWGYNNSGQLGDSSLTNRSSPVAVIGLANVTDLAGGEWHSVARRSDATIWAWGLNQSSQLGTGAPSGTAASYSPVPVQVGAVSVTVTPATASVTGGQTRAFTAVVAGAVNQAVTWSVQEAGGGSMTAGGLYIAPSTGGTYHVVATSVADPSKIGTAIVMVTAAVPNVLSTTLTSVTPGQSGLGYLVTLTGKVMRGGGSSLAPTGTVTFTEALSGTILGSAPLSRVCGLYNTVCADLTIRTDVAGLGIPSAGSNNEGYTITSSYSGDSTYVPSSDTYGAWLGVTRYGNWTTVQSFGYWGMGLAGIGGKVYALGGYDNLNVGHNDINEYDASTNGWTLKGSLPAGFSRSVAAAPNGKIYLFQGGATQAYDPLTNTTVATLPTMPTYRTRTSATAVPDGRVFVIGGRDNDGFPRSDVEVFDTATETWSAATPMPTPRFDASAAYVGGFIYVVGGSDTTTVGLTTVEIYDVSAGTWSTGQSLNLGRTEFGLAVTANGTLMAIGGVYVDPTMVGTQFHTDSDRLNTTVAGSFWTLGSPIQSQRRGCGAVSLPDYNGAIYLFGGMTPSESTTTSGEMYFSRSP